MPLKRPAIAEIIELLGKKWVMRIIWELRGEALSFRELQSACDELSPTVLNGRLKLLQQAKLAARDERRGYTVTPLGRELLTLYKPLNQWAERWQRQRGRTEN